MAIKDILTVVDVGGKRPAAHFAAALADRADAHLTGLSITYEPLIPSYGIAVPSDLRTTVREAATRQVEAANAAFKQIAESAGVRYEAVMLDLPSDGYFGDLLQRSRLTDLVVIGQENPDAPEPLRNAMIESLLFEGGAPTLLVPHIGVREFRLDDVVIAWDGSHTAARAVRAGLSMLAFTKAVTILVVDRRNSEGAEELAVFLDRHGLKVELSVVPSGDIPAADVVLNHVADRGHDWIVMGAYWHTRMRERFLGGATREILGSMTVPVLMTH